MQAEDRGHASGYGKDPFSLPPEETGPAEGADGKQVKHKRKTLAERRADIFRKENETIVNILERFDGKITLTEILSMDMNRLYGLLEAKNKFDEARAKAEAKAEAAVTAASNANNPK